MVVFPQIRSGRLGEKLVFVGRGWYNVDKV